MAAPPVSAAGRERPSSSLTQWLRGRPDAALAELLRRRPDLALPAPADVAALAGRAEVRSSVQRAVDGLDAFTLRILQALALAGGQDVCLAAVTELTGSLAEGDLQRPLDELLALALVWGDDPHLHLVAAVRDALGPYPAGLGRPAAVLLRPLATVPRPPTAPGAEVAPDSLAAVLADPARTAELVAGCGPAERELLERLAAGPPVGLIRTAPSASGDDDSPAYRLLARGLLVAVDAQTVELPREVAYALRPVPIGSLEPQPPSVPVVERGPDELDRLGTTAVLETLRLVEALAGSWTVRPPAQLRAGGVGVRELRRSARELGVEEPRAALIAETAAAAGLLNATHGAEPVYLPTVEFDRWRAQPPAARWSALAGAWLQMTRRPALVGHRGERDRVITALSPDVERGTVAALRTQVLAVLAALPPGSAPRERADVLRRLAWQAPRRAATQRACAEELLAEADALGVTAAGGLTGYSRTLLAGSRSVAEQVLSGAMPAPVTHFLVQPDLTIVVPGPPSAELAAELTLAADLESTGGASVYRITESSIRRALDAGRSRAELVGLLAERSRTPVPQALRYLVDDVARRHGSLRTGVASAYLRCDDESLLARVLSDRDLAALQLRRIAPSVAISSAPVPHVLDVLRSAGYAPAAEAPDGEVVALDSEPARAPARQPREVRSRFGAGPGAHLDEVVRRIRAGDAIPRTAGFPDRAQHVARQVPGVTSATNMALLREAIREGRRVLIGSAEPDGTVTRHEILPISLGGGFVRGHTPDTTRLQAFALHRITGASVLDDEDSGDGSA
ncbi:MAG: helicase-associated domain-containing protein [Jatrophihabitantaceae bacterium]